MMTEGILIFANNNEEINYGKISYISAKFVKKSLGKPVSLVTDTNTKSGLLAEYDDVDEVFDLIIIDDVPAIQSQYKRYHDGTNHYKSLKFNNYSRANAYDYTPYDKTLVIDCDLLILDDKLNSIWNSEEDFMISSNHYDLNADRNFSEFDRISDPSIEFYWATAFYFVKNQKNKSFFDLCKHIIDNYAFYRFVYRIDNPMMRNDFVFSIAQHIMNGFENRSRPCPLPCNINYALDRDDIYEIKDNKTFVFLVNQKKFLDQYVLVKAVNKNLHIMNKWAFLRNAEKLLGVVNDV